MSWAGSLTGVVISFIVLFPPILKSRASSLASSGLSPPEGGGEFSLGHLSYQEFLAAKGIVLGQRLEVLRDNFFDPWWRNVFLFYAGIAGDVHKLFGMIQAKTGLRRNRGLLDEMLAEARYSSDFVRAITNDFELCYESEDDECDQPGDDEFVPSGDDEDELEHNDKGGEGQ
jgi:hypothetical protein